MESAPQEGKACEGPANAAAAAESARSAFPASVPRGPGPAASWRADRSPRAGTERLQFPARTAKAVLPGNGAVTRSRELAGRRGREGLWCMPGWGAQPEDGLGA